MNKVILIMALAAMGVTGCSSPNNGNNTSDSGQPATVYDQAPAADETAPPGTPPPMGTPNAGTSTMTP